MSACISVVSCDPTHINMTGHFLLQFYSTWYMHPLFVDGGQHAFFVCAWFMEFGALVCDMHGWCNASRGFFHGYIKGGLFSSTGFLYLYFSHSEGGNTLWT